MPSRERQWPGRIQATKPPPCTAHAVLTGHTSRAQDVSLYTQETDLNTPEVQGKMEAALVWCQRATEELSKSNEKPWFYLLIPHSKITLNLDFSGANVKFRKSM